MDAVLIDQMARLFAREASDARLRAARAGQAADGWEVLAAAGLPSALAEGLDWPSLLAIARAHGAAGAPWPLVQVWLESAESPPEAAAALATAEIAGLIAAVLAMTVEWTQTRQQFGRPLAGNQAVQHSLAQLAGMAAAADAAVAVAAAAIGHDALRVSAAKARASAAAGTAAAIAHQLHGAIGIAAEHRLQLFTRALWQWRDWAGSEHQHHATLGRAALAAGSAWAVATQGCEREPLRANIRAFLAEHLAEMPPARRAHSWNGHDADFSRKLGARGWLGLTWPRALGGQERNALDRLALLEELLAAGAPVAAHWIAERQTAPLLLKYGTPAQQQAYLPAIARGELFACIGMSEPGAGSDLAALTTRATRTAAGWRISGRKLWTTYAHKAHVMLLLCRTGPGQRHEGLSQLLVPMDTPGIHIRPIPDLMGAHHFNEVLFDDVLVPETALVGTEGMGWQQVMQELAYERSGPERFLSSFVLLEQLVAELGPAAPAAAHAPIGRLLAELIVLRQMAHDLAVQLGAGEDPAHGAAIMKDLGADFEQAIPEVARALLPDDASPDLLATLYETVHIAPMVSLRGGTREILRGIIARGLGVR